MEEVIYSYKLSKKIYLDGIALTGSYGISKKKQAAFLIIGLLALANELYAVIGSGKIGGRNILLFIAIALLILITLLGPVYEKKKILKDFCECDVKVTLKKTCITVESLKNITVDLKNYRGYKNEQEYFIVYYDGGYVLLPKNATNGFGVNDTENILSNFHLTANNCGEDNSLEKEEQ